MFRFDGLVGHVYNLISAPYMQLNGLVDKGRDVAGTHNMQDVLRSVGVMWEQFKVGFSLDHKGNV